jgi:hypothetical protein
MKLLEIRDIKKKDKAPEAPFEKGSATEIANWLKKHHDSTKDALAALADYRSEAGKLTDGMAAKLDHVKALLHAKAADEKRKAAKEEDKPKKVTEEVEDDLLEYITKAYRVIVKHGFSGLDPAGQRKIERIYETWRGYLMKQDIEGFMKAYDEAGAKHPDAFDFFVEEILAQAKVKDINELFAKL